ncbi:uncharacterized protein LOC126904581 [Daktulosphaira vitifoliae]|uniref:uncharacterized protein LOC126904581 n=1 Tax=Daktulosphaira vitifoliae TaxID=58002 RepID=UPI0021AA2129|nr:uncharacterized protein LOC126904581 [Daktulosphaira vitifoliae]XP_050539673.1 uncharacterized protein LOC126904581 [Daktulosphaira vitifoliae]
MKSLHLIIFVSDMPFLMRLIFAIFIVYTAAEEKKDSALDKRQVPVNGDFTDRSSDGSYAFRYADSNQFHTAAANKDNVVVGNFGSRNPETGRIGQTSYSSGPRGFRAQGPDIARQTDLSQIRSPYIPPVPIDSSKYDPAYDRYYDPNEDASYKYTVRTPTLSKAETSDSRGRVIGAYSYLDDVGKRHDVQYEAGAGTGFHIKTAHPDSIPFNGVFYSGPPGKPGGLPRGTSSVVLGKDGSYGFTASGPDQRRSEVSDSNGRVQGSYTYVDDKGVQRTVQYVAGSGIGYRVINNSPVLQQLPFPAPSILPPSLLITSTLSPSNFEQDLFGSTSSTTSSPSLSSPRRDTEINNSYKGNDKESDFLSPDSSLPLGSAFPEDDPLLPPRKWPLVYKNKDEESFFQSLEKFNKVKENSQKTHLAVPENSYGQLKPIVVDQINYGEYGGTDYQKPHHSKDTVEYENNNFIGFPPGTIVKGYVQNIDILPFGYRVPSPSYVFEKQFGNTDDIQNSVQK